MLNNIKGRLFLTVGLSAALCLVLDIVIMRRVAEAGALLDKSGPSSEKKQLLARVNGLKQEYSELRLSYSKSGKKYHSLAEANKSAGSRVKEAIATFKSLEANLAKANVFRDMLSAASCDGNYVDLMRAEKYPSDKADYGYFKDVGSRFLRSGYWVYNYPYWFVWKRSKREEEKAERERQASEAAATRQEERDEKYGSEADAWVTAEQYIKQDLIHPSTADFGWLPPDAKLSPGTGLWFVKGTVKAKNSFGLELKFRWYVQLKKTKEGDWKLIDDHLYEDSD